MRLRSRLCCCFFLILIGSANASTYSIGGKDIEIPSPKGFTLVTEEMEGVYRLFQQMVDPTSDQLAYYISESVVQAAKSGEMPPLDRYYILKVNKKLKNMVADSNDFAKIKGILKRQDKYIPKVLEEQLPGIMEQSNKGISNEFGLDFSLEISQMVPLQPHYETDNALADSMYIYYVETVDGVKETNISSLTTTYLNVSGKIIYLFCYGAKEDLEWTRDASNEWAGMIMTNNKKTSTPLVR